MNMLRQCVHAGHVLSYPLVTAMMHCQLIEVSMASWIQASVVRDMLRVHSSHNACTSAVSIWQGMGRQALGTRVYTPRAPRGR